MNDIVIHQPDPEDHERKGGLLVAQANEVTVTSLDEREHAGMFLQEINDRIKLIKKEFDGTEDDPGPVSLAYKAWKSGVALRDRALLSFESAKTIINQKIRKFEFDIEQKRIVEARRLEAVAREKAEKERQKQIDEAKRQGDREAAQELKNAPLNVVPQAPKTPEINKVAGMRRSSPDWDFTILDANKVPDQFWVIDEQKLRRHVKSFGMAHGVTGISVFDRRSQGE